LYTIQEGLAVASIVRDDPSTLPGDDPSTTMREFGSEFET